MCNPFRQEDLVFISNSTLQNHYCLGLSSFGELIVQISDWLLMCVFMTKISFLLQHSNQKNSNVQYVQTGTLSFHFSFNFTKPFLSGSKYIWRTNCLDKCSGTFEYVYDQHYALAIVTQPKKEECAIPLDKNTQYSFIVQFYRTIFDWV